MALVQSLVIIVLLLATPTSALAAQMDVYIPWDSDEINPSYKFLRVITINYEDGGKLADLLAGKYAKISFTADSTTPGINELVEKINASLMQTSSQVIVTDVIVHYRATLSGNDKTASIEYNIELIPTMKNYSLERESNMLIDAQWRGIKIAGPVIIDTLEFGNFDINSPDSAVGVIVPEVLEEIKKTDAAEILKIELLDASGILHLPLSKWHFLFDPTAVLVQTKDFGYNGTSVISHYSMGECKIGIDVCGDRFWEKEFVLDQRYSINAIESQDDATISLEGYAKDTKIGNIEIIEVTPQSNEIIYPPIVKEFPVSVIYGMAGAAGIGTIAVLWVSSRKLKKEKGMGQRGIDPSQLRAQATSSSAGGYQTNRGEAYLASEDKNYNKSQRKDEVNLTSTRGSMPKGWS